LPATCSIKLTGPFRSGVVVKNDAVNVSKNTTTNDEGHFEVTGLPSGVYTVEVSAQGSDGYPHGSAGSGRTPQEIAFRWGGRAVQSST